MAQVNSSQSQTSGDSRLDTLHVTLDIVDEQVIDEPTASEKIAFFLSFLPLVGYVGAAMAAFAVRNHHRAGTKTHGLTYAALALQVFYTLLMLTGLVVSMQIQQSSLAPTKPAEATAQSFITTVQASNFTAARAYFANQVSNAPEVTLPMYRAAMTGTPLLVESRMIEKPTFQDQAFSAYADKPLSYQLWHIGTIETNSQYLIIILSEVARDDWRIIQVQSLEAPGDSSAKSAIDQVVGALLAPAT